MSLKTTLLLVAAVSIALAGSVCHADQVAVAVVPNNNGYAVLETGLAGSCFGWEFKVGSQPITVTKLGMNTAQPGNQLIGIWKYTGGATTLQPVVQLTVPVSSTDVVANFRYAPVETPVTLDANTIYEIVALQVTGYKNYGGNTSASADPAIQLRNGVYGGSISGASASNTSLLYPVNFLNGTSIIRYTANANFQFTVPEPATMALIGMGGVAMLLKRRK